MKKAIIFFAAAFCTQLLCHAYEAKECKLQTEYVPAGVNLYFEQETSKKDEITLAYKFYNPHTDSLGSGTLGLEKKLFLPYGTEFCFWYEYGNGKKSVAKSYTIKKLKNDEAENLIKLELPQKEDNKADLHPYKILNWHFIEFKDAGTIKFLIAETENEPLLEQLDSVYNSPIALQRSSDCFLFWINEAESGGGVRKITLPKKPSLNGLPANQISQSKIKLSFDGMSEKYKYNFGCKSTLPASGSFENYAPAEGKYIFDTETGTEKSFYVKIQAAYAGEIHGEFFLSFTIDKLPPDEPILQVKSNSELACGADIIADKKNENEQLCIDITPPLYRRYENKIILTGKDFEKINYTITAYTKDAAGNKSKQIVKRVLVQRNVLYINAEIISRGNKKDGSPLRPFASINEASAFIYKTLSAGGKSKGIIKWTLILQSNLYYEEPILVMVPIKITGASNKRIITFPKNGGFIVDNSSLELENLILKRSEQVTEPREVPIVYVSGSNIKLSDIDIRTVQGGGTFSLLDSHAEILKTSITSIQKNHCFIFSIKNSSCILKTVDLKGSGHSISALSFVNSRCIIDSLNAELYSAYSAAAVKAAGSHLKINNFSCTHFAKNNIDRDYAVILDENSNYETSGTIEIKGFAGVHKK